MQEQVKQRKVLSLSAAGLVALALSVVALLAMAPSAQAEERVCRGSIGAVTVDNLRVPAYATCNLSGTRVKGTVKVEYGSTLYAYGVRVNGNVQSEGFRNVYLTRSRTATSFVGGSVQLKNGLGGGTGYVAYTYVKGDVQYEANRAKMFAGYSTLLANLQAVQNKGGVQIVNNRISQNLQCKENVPAPTGGGNTAGAKEGQCARL